MSQCAALIRRKVLGQEHFALAIRAVASKPKSCLNNMMLSHVDGVCIDFERAPDERLFIGPSDGLLVHASHFVSPAAVSKLRDTGLADAPDSCCRDLRVRQLLDSAGSHLAPEDLKRALFDDFGSSYSVCRPLRAGSDGNLSAAVAMLVMQPALRQIGLPR